MAKRTLSCVVSEILKKRRTKQLTAHEIAQIIVDTEHEFVQKKIKKTKKTDKVLVFQLMSEIGAQYHALQQCNVHKTTSRPCKYFFKAPAKKSAK